MDGESTALLFAEPRHVTSREQCFFYHSVDLPAQGSVEGIWDLRGHESEYLGDVALRGKRVLEIGPASGHLSFFMEREGAEVVSVEAEEDYPWEYCWDSPDREPAELPEKLAAHREMMARVRNSYWFCHRAFQSRARVHYGSAYHLPRELGTFDVSVVGCVLLHNKNPLRILENAARLTKDTVVVVEPFHAMQLAQAPVVFLPSPGEPLWHTWWGFSPVYFVGILRSMGLSEHRVTFHRQLCYGAPMDLFTVVARRAKRGAGPAEGAPIEVELTSVVERLRVEAGETMFIPVRIANRGLVPLSSAEPQPLLLSYHWRDQLGRMVVLDGVRTSLARTLHPGDRETLLLAARAPMASGPHTLEISMLTEGVTWYDSLPGLPIRIPAMVTPG